MNIEHENCLKCDNRGIIRQYTYDTKHLVITLPPGVIPPIIDNSRVTEAYCNCYWGFDRKRVEQEDGYLPKND